MIQLIREIISRYGGRIAGSHEEYLAQMYFYEILRGFCSKVEVQPFKAPLTSKFQSLKLFSALYIINLVLYLYIPTLAAVLAVVNVVFFFGHFVMNNRSLDFLYPTYESSNVVGTIEPQGEVKSTLLFAGHMDSVWEFQWWYRLGVYGFYLNTLTAVLFVGQMLFYLVMVGLILTGSVAPEWTKYIWFGLVLLSPATFSMYSKHGSVKVDGAIDNLSGIAVSWAIGKHFLDPTQRGKSRLKHTRIKVVSFGSEETGILGSKNFVKAYGEPLKAENATLINIDTIKNKEQLQILLGERGSGVWYPKDLHEKMQASFDALNTSVKYTTLGVGATDAANFIKGGIPAISIIGIESRFPDLAYHTRNDNLNHLDPEGIETLKDILIDFVEKWDKAL